MRPVLSLPALPRNLSTEQPFPVDFRCQRVHRNGNARQRRKKRGSGQTARGRRKVEAARWRRNQDTDRSGNPKGRAWGYRQHRPRHRSRRAKLPAMLQKKRGILRFLLGAL
ncbi:hypothetical protein NDU88_000557 [Pleurodeles waltl]|uniref:Uncharacterized protein n=1 Tax=Pleurodeles waltl TaxID=8319 RepID=A0AAV7SXK6_PLEWA|nr:hypothetical protein NDU88_000557 [Pleurodeles waltl]